MRFIINIVKIYKLWKIVANTRKFKIFSKNSPKYIKRSERPGVSRHEYFVLLFLHELTLNHALRVTCSWSKTRTPADNSFDAFFGRKKKLTCRAWFSGSSCTKSNTKYSCLEIPGRSELFVYFGEFFEKILNYFTLAFISEILYISSMLLLKRMQEDLL